MLVSLYSIKDTVYATKITLFSDKWNVETLTLEVFIEGIKEDEKSQVIHVHSVPNNGLNTDIENCDITAISQIEDGIIFSCETIPYNDVEFYIEWYDVCWVENSIPTVPDLSDFDYNYDEINNTYTITAWKGTKNGVESTDFYLPNNRNIII